MRIAFIDFIFERGAPIGTTGLSEVVWRLAEPLAQLGHEVHIVAPYRDAGFPAQNIQVHRFDLPPINYRNIVGHLLIVRRAIDVLGRLGPLDLVHAPEYLSTALLCALGPHVPVVLTEPGNIFERVANGNPYDLVTTQVYKWAARTSGRRCAAIIATSAEMAEWWRRSGATDDRIARIALGVDLAGFGPRPAARAQLGWGEQPQIIFVARLSVETGAEYLIRALPEVLRAYPGARLQIVGSGPAAESLRELAQAQGVGDAVAWHGWVPLDELASYYSAADLMVFPGTSGGTPRVMLQAMACGTPFVGSAIGGIVDHVEHGRTGWLVAPRDPAALAAAIVGALANPAAARAVAERSRAYVAGLQWSEIAERVHREVYQRVCRRDMAAAAPRRSQGPQIG
jgi:glycosyltransferase involved in cell wall biosynthesis